MKISQWLEQEKLNQSDLGRIIRRDRVRAHRIVNGAKPNDEEMHLIYLASKGLVTGNDFYDLPITKTKRPPKPEIQPSQ